MSDAAPSLAIVTGALSGIAYELADAVPNAGFIPGSFQAVYNGSKAFLNSFAYALRNELKTPA